MLNLNENGLSFDDVLLVPQKSSVLPKETIVKTKLSSNTTLDIPLISSAMDTVTEASLATEIARIGGIGIIHKNFSTIEAQINEIYKVKTALNKYQGRFVREASPVSEISNFFKKNKILNNAPIINCRSSFLGCIDRHSFKGNCNVNLIVTKDLLIDSKKELLLSSETNYYELFKKMEEGVFNDAIIVDNRNKYVGMVSKEDYLNDYDSMSVGEVISSPLMVGAAVGIGKNERDRAIALYNSKVDVIVIDTAHAHSSLVIEQLEWIKKNTEVPIIVGNIVTADAATCLINKGADSVKVGIGPGSICTTRIISGVGVPQLTAIANVSSVAKKFNIPVIADGGIRFSGDIVKALAAGASSVMIGNLFAGCDESPGELVTCDNNIYKKYRGMGSLPAMINGSSNRYFQDKSADKGKLISEGVEGYIKYSGSVSDVIFQLIGGLRAGMGYTGSKSIEDLQNNANFIRVFDAGIKEGHVHDIIKAVNSPNYKL